MRRYLKILCSVMIMGLCTTPLLTKNSRIEQEALDRETIDDDGDNHDQNTDNTSIDTMDIIVTTGIVCTVTLTTAYFGLKQYSDIDLLERAKKLFVSEKKTETPNNPPQDPIKYYDVYLPEILN